MAADGEDVIIRRNRPGTSNCDIYNWPDQEYTEMDSILDGKEQLELGQLLKNDLPSSAAYPTDDS